MINGFKLHENSTAPAGFQARAACDRSPQGGRTQSSVVRGRSSTALGRLGASCPTCGECWPRAPRRSRLTAPFGESRIKTSFTPQERNLAYLAIIYENECTYCMAGHTNLSKMTKVDDAAIAAARVGKPIDDAKLEALRQFAAKVTRQRGVVSEADVAAFKAAGYDNRAGARCAGARRDQAHLQLHQSPRADAQRRLHERRRMDCPRQTQAGRISSDGCRLCLW
jgi:AhpD family alkylhydroperoxidase